MPLGRRGKRESSTLRSKGGVPAMGGNALRGTRVRLGRGADATGKENLEKKRFRVQVDHY